MDIGIKNLVFSGGGLKGIVYIGCIEALEKYNIMKFIKKISATSIGSIFSFLILLGYKSTELKELNYKLDFSYLKVWDEKLSSLGYKIWEARKDFFNDFIPIFENLWKELNCDFTAQIKYNIQQVLLKNEYYQVLTDNINKDIKRGYTTTGPHKDNINLFFNNMAIKDCGSQGEKKLFLVVLKITESIYISTKMKNEPIILLDDLFAMLDKNRGLKILNLLTNNFQIFITTTDANAETYFPNKENLNFIKLEECKDICFAA